MANGRSRNGLQDEDEDELSTMLQNNLRFSEQAVQRNLQQQIDDDARLARQLADSYDEHDYQMFRDRRIAEQFANSSDETLSLDRFSEVETRTQYAATWSAERASWLERNVANTRHEPARMDHSTSAQTRVLRITESQESGSGGKRRQILRCEACSDSKAAEQMITVSCGHHMCDDCLARLFSSAMTDETLFPPRCCRTHEIDVSAALPLLSNELATRFQAKEIEFRTQDRTYCQDPRCSTFIPPDTIVWDIATCPTCKSRTCALCKGEAHQGQDCPLDEGKQQLEELAQEEGWRQCGGCHRMVELSYGCFHMT